MEGDAFSLLTMHVESLLPGKCPDNFVEHVEHLREVLPYSVKAR